MFPITKQNKNLKLVHCFVLLCYPVSVLRYPGKPPTQKLEGFGEDFREGFGEEIVD